MPPRTAKSKVVRLCSALSSAYPRLSDDEIQEAALDLHDIENACRKIAHAIHGLRRTGALSKGKTADLLSEVEGELIDHIEQSHLSSLKRFFKHTDSASDVKKPPKRR